MIRINVKNKRNLITEFAITPFIDVVFNLLLFFMVSSSVMNISQIEINLPESSGNAIIEDGSLMIKISEEGKIYFDGKEVELTNLENAIPNPFNPDASIIIAADKKTQIGLIINIWNIVQKKDYKNITLATAENEKKFK